MRNLRPRWLGVVAALAGLLLSAPDAVGSCTVEQSDDISVFRRHASQECSEQERAARAIKAEELLAAIQSGKGIDLERAIVVGDLHFETLPLVKLATVSNQPVIFQEQVRAQHMTEVRRIAGPVTIKDSLVRGTVGTGLKEGYLVFQGPVTFSGTTFEQGADFSRSAFFGPVEIFHAIFLAQAFFIQALFAQPAQFGMTAFGVHTRFHRAMFSDTASFRHAVFNGLAEFLEVTFTKDTSFVHASFKMGTGFSGSRFAGTLDFTDALFEREAFFTFAIFERNASFHRTTFRSTADFSDAQFKGVDDFSKAFFNVEPRFARVKAHETRPMFSGWQDPRILYGMAAALALVTFFFLWTLRKQ